jgi:uncharacterized protein YrrD
MLQRVGKLRGYAIGAADGEIGSVADLLFEDDTATIRWVVVDTGTWLPGRKILLPPDLLEVHHQNRVVGTALTREQVRNSPDIASDKPVDRQLEESIHRYYGWDPYWIGDTPALIAPWGSAAVGAAAPVRDPVDPVVHELAVRETERADPHLRSAHEVIGYYVHATDGDIGHVEDLLADARLSMLRAIVIDTRNWLPGRTVVVPVARMQEVNWYEQRIETDLTRRQIEDSPEFDPARMAGGQGSMPSGAALWRS